MEEQASANERKKRWEEIQERKVAMAKERGARVMRVQTPVSGVMFRIMTQFDQAYLQLKTRMGEPGGISFEEGAALMDRVQQVMLEMSDITKDLSKKVRFRYYVPDELKEVQRGTEVVE